MAQAGEGESAMAVAARSVAEVKEERRKRKERRRQRENGPAHQTASFMRRDALLPQKAAYRTSPLSWSFLLCVLHRMHEGTGGVGRKILKEDNHCGKSL
jgi:hypothetical protein